VKAAKTFFIYPFESSFLVDGTHAGRFTESPVLPTLDPGAADRLLVLSADWFVFFFSGARLC